METCTSCGAQAAKLLTVFPGASEGDGLPFCFDCVHFGACELPFLAQRGLGWQALVGSAQRSNRAMLRTRRRSTALEARVAELEETLRGRSGR
jgi:hypothetical protein